MTSSFMLSKLNNRGSTGSPYIFKGLPGSTLGGMEDSYIKLQGNCHPDFTTHPIGRPDGVKVCMRKPPPDQAGPPGGGCSPRDNAEFQKRSSQGYNRGSVRMYDVKADFPVQEWNPQYYADRRTPWEQDLLAKDYLRWPLRYSGTGINPLHAPAQLRDTGKPYYQYGYSFTPEEDYNTGARIATKSNQSLPEVKYDVTRLHQPYTVWKHEQAQMNATLPNGKDVNSLDTTYQKRIV
jgi:hypothetical protein